MPSLVTRRRHLAHLVGGVAAGQALLAAPRLRAQKNGQVVVIGGGFGGAMAARALAAEAIAVTLVDPDPIYIACPLSNAVIGGMRELGAQQFDRRRLAGAGVALAPLHAIAVDADRREVRLSDGSVLAYDRLVLAPGIALRFEALPGYDEAAAEIMPHAWKAGEQTLLLRRQLAAMDDGGLVVISAPANPFRCPPGPYERASLIAHYLKTAKPRSKLLILDAKDTFSKQKLFQKAWAELYPGLIEWVGLSSGGKVTQVDPATRTLVTEFGRHRADVANVIAPQQAARITKDAQVADRTGWCPVDPVSFESKLVPHIHVLGDAAIMGAMPKSAFAANGQAKACAAAVAALLREKPPPALKLVNTCYSLVAPDYGISVAGVYQPTAAGLLGEVEGAGGTSPIDAPAGQRAQEALYANAWFRTITAETFG